MRAALALTFLLSACAHPPAFLSEPAEVEADGTWRHPASGMAFPVQVAGFGRTRIAHFTPDGSDAAVAYDLVTRRGDVASTVYLHRAPDLLTLGLPPDAVAAEQARSCRGELNRRIDEMQRTHLDPSPPRTREISVVNGGATRPGLLVESGYAARLGGDEQRVRTELALFCAAAPGWTLEFRFSFPGSLQAEDRIVSFIGALDWSGLGGG